MRNPRLTIAITVTALLFLFGWYVFFRPVQVIHWGRSYSIHQKNPYDLWLSHELLGNSLGLDTVFTIHQALDSTLDSIVHPEHTSYVCIGKQAYYLPENLETIYQYVEAGGTALIALEDWFDLYDLLRDEAEEWMVDVEPSYYSDSIWTWMIPPQYAHGQWDTLRFMPENLDSLALYRTVFYLKDSMVYHPDTLAIDQLPDGEVVPLCLRFALGDGHVILHASPLHFTNFFVREEVGKHHLEYMASYLPSGPVYWDEFSKLPLHSPPPQPRSYLDYVLKHPALRWAWYLLLTGGLLYVLTHVRRQQRAIPVLRRPENTSIQYAETLGDLYLSTGDHLTWIKMRSELFWQNLRHTLNIHISSQSPQFLKEVALKSGIELAEIEAVKSSYIALLRRPGIPTAEVIAYEEKLQKILVKMKRNNDNDTIEFNNKNTSQIGWKTR